MARSNTRRALLKRSLSLGFFPCAARSLIVGFSLLLARSSSTGFFPELRPALASWVFRRIRLAPRSGVFLGMRLAQTRWVVLRSRLALSYWVTPRPRLAHLEWVVPSEWLDLGAVEWARSRCMGRSEALARSMTGKFLQARGSPPRPPPRSGRRDLRELLGGVVPVREHLLPQPLARHRPLPERWRLCDVAHLPRVDDRRVLLRHLLHRVGSPHREAFRLPVDHPQVVEEELHGPAAGHVVEMSRPDHSRRLFLPAKLRAALGAELGILGHLALREAPGAEAALGRGQNPSARPLDRLLLPELVGVVPVAVLAVVVKDPELHPAVEDGAEVGVAVPLLPGAPVLARQEAGVLGELGGRHEALDALHPHPPLAALVRLRLPARPRFPLLHIAGFPLS